jgi:hypothetical protein
VGRNTVVVVGRSVVVVATAAGMLVDVVVEKSDLVSEPLPEVRAIVVSTIATAHMNASRIALAGYRRLGAR